MRLSLLYLLPLVASSANLIQNAAFTGPADSPAGWRTWAPRAENKPTFAVVRAGSGNHLSIRSRRFADYGKWVGDSAPVEGNAYYRFDVEYRTQNVASEAVSVAAMLSWFAGEASRDALQRDYVDRLASAGEWRRLSRTVQAPARATAAQIELVLRWSNGGSVEWRSPVLTKVAAPSPRLVKVATTHIKPKPPYSIESNVKLMREMIDAAGQKKADIVCLSENLAERGVGLPIDARAHPIPGPITQQLGESARKNRVWVVTALVEKEGDVIYNTAVLLNREGQLVGKYRKVHLPLAEAEDGMTPGSEYAVFDTDFGRIGLLVCWDNWFVEPARILRLQGAEMLLFPLAGDVEAHWDLMSRARAVENGVYLVSSNTVGGASRIVNPAGEVVGEAKGDFSLAVAEVDLNREWRTPWLSVGPGEGEGKSLYLKERRPDTYSPLGTTKLPR